MIIKKSLTISAIVMVLVAVLSGCVKFEMDVKVNSNKSADVNVTLLVNSMVAGMSDNGGGINLEEVKTKAEQAGYSAASQKEGDMIGYKFSKHFNNIVQLSEDTSTNTNLQDLFKDGKSDTKIFTIKKGFIKDVYSINLDMDLDNINAPSNDDNEFTNSIIKTMIAQMDFKFKTTLPIKTVSNNASNVSNDGKSLEWQLIPGQKNKIEMEFLVWKITNIILLIVTILLLSIIVLFLIIRRWKNTMEITTYDNTIDK